LSIYIGNWGATGGAAGAARLKNRLGLNE